MLSLPIDISLRSLLNFDIVHEEYYEKEKIIRSFLNSRFRSFENEQKPKESMGLDRS